MPMMKPLIILSTVTLLSAGVASAQDAPQDTRQDILAAESTPFISADADMNGALGFGEFTAYVEAKARAGDETYAETLSSGDYDLAFAERDLDANGVLDARELGEVQSDMDGEWSTETPDDTDGNMDNADEGMVDLLPDVDGSPMEDDEY